MYRDVKQWQDIRHRVLKCGVSKRQILRETGVSWHTLTKILKFPLPQPYKRRKGTQPKPPSLTRSHRRKDQIWCDVLEALATASANDARTIVSAVSVLKPNQVNVSNQRK